MTYTPSEYIALMYQRLENVTQAKLLAQAVLDVQNKMSERIFENGLASDNSSIGTYKGKDIYVNPSKVRNKFPTVGKTGNAKFESTGKPHKTGYFETYADFKKVQRGTTIVNLTVTQDLKNDFNKVPNFDVNNATITVNDLSMAKIEGNESNFEKQIFSFSEEERELFKSTYQQLIEEEFKPR